MSGALGQVVKQADLDKDFLTGPGEDLVVKTIAQMVTVQGNKVNGVQTYPFKILFGAYTPNKAEQRWSDYQRFDWSIRQLPAMNVFESGAEERTSDEGFLNGSVTFQVFWPPSQRRSDLGRVQAAFRSIMTEFFSSRYVADMLDELYYIQRTNKVYGLNEYGKNITWSPNVEGVLETGEIVPMTVLEVKYRIDLRAWHRALEYMNRTKAEPYQTPLSDLTVIGGEYDGVMDDAGQDVQVVVNDEINVSNP